MHVLNYQLQASFVFSLARFTFFQVKKDKLIEENQLLLQKVNSVESLGQGQTEEMSSLKTDLHKQTIELQETQEKYTQKCSECEELTTVVSGLFTFSSH